MKHYCKKLYELIIIAGTIERSAPDCRTSGCGLGADCLRQGLRFVCKCPPGMTGKPEVECRKGMNNTLFFSTFRFISSFIYINHFSHKIQLHLL